MDNSTAVTLRPALPQDVPAMAVMARDLVEVGLHWRYTARRLTALLGDAETMALVASDGAGVQGYAVMQFGERGAHLVLLAVRPARQRQGIGARLIDWLHRSAEVAGLGAIELEVRADNRPAQAFYRRLGFVETRLLPRYYDGRIAARRMRRPVGIGREG